MRKLVIVCALVAAAAGRAMGQDVFASMDRQSVTQLERVLDEARGRGLPTERIVAKVNLGVSKRVSATKIIAAARAVAARLEEARDALAPNPTEADIMAGEDALSLGVSVSALHTVRVASPDRSVAFPIGVLAQLVANNVSVKRATSIVVDLISRGATDAQCTKLIADVNADIAAGASANDALDIRLRGLVPQIGPPGSFGFGNGDKVTVPTATSTGGHPPPKPPPPKKP